VAVVSPEQIDRILARSRLHLQGAFALQVALLAVVALAGTASAAEMRIGPLDAGTVMIALAGLLWIFLLVRSVRHGHFVQHATALISQGMFEQAVPLLAEAAERFSLFRISKLLALEHLGVIAHSQGQYPSAARLSAEVLRYRLARRRGLGKMASLVLADSLMEMHDLDGAAEALSYMDGQTLTIPEQLQALPVMLRWQLTVGKYKHAVHDLRQKVRLAERLDSERASLVHLLLAAAARRCGLEAAWSFLFRRAALYHDLDVLAQKNPSIGAILKELQAQDGEPSVTS